MTAPAAPAHPPRAAAHRPHPIRPGQRYRALYGLRAVAALAVIVTHVAFWTGNYTTGWAGRAAARLDVSVALFFVVSGFLLTLPMFRAAARGRPQPSLRGYARRRALRILPAYWIAVALALLLLPSNRGADAGTWWRHLLLLQIYGPGWSADGLVQTWSLCTEVSFYLVLPLLVRRLCGRPGAPWRPRRVLAGIGALTLAGYGWLLWVSADTAVLGPLNLWLPSFAGWFGAGMAMAVLTESPPRIGRRLRELAASPGTCLAGAAALYALACTDVAGPLGLDRPAPAEVLVKNALYLGVGVLAVAPLVLGGGGWWGVLLSTRPAVYIGQISYGLFLYHMTVLIGGYAVLHRQQFTGGMPATLFLTVVVATALAALSYRFVEAPLMWEPAAARTPAPHSPAPRPAEPQEREPAEREPAERGPQPAEPAGAAPRRVVDDAGHGPTCGAGSTCPQCRKRRLRGRPVVRPGQRARTPDPDHLPGWEALPAIFGRRR